MATKMDTGRWAETIEVLSCDIGSRPPAPGIEALLPQVRHVRREAQALVIDYDPAAASDFAAFAAAERVCCASLGWEVDTAASRLTIRATSEQLDALQTAFPAA